MKYRWLPAAAAAASLAMALAGVSAPGAALASSARSSVPAVTGALPAQDSVPTLQAPGPGHNVSYPADQQFYSGTRQFLVQAPQYTRITWFKEKCTGTLTCVATITPDGRSAALSIGGPDRWQWAYALNATIKADADAPLAGGQYSGSVTFDGVTQPLTVNIAPGTPGSVAGIFPANNAGGGTRVAYVDPGSKADQSGLQTGDVITAIDGQPTPNTAAFRQAAAAHRSGATVPVTVQRNGQPITINLTLD